MLMFVALMCFKDFQMPAVGQELSPNVWQIREDPERGIYDAVILDDVTEFNLITIDRYRAIRILSENGKQAAGFFDETGTAKNLKGRVITADGKVTEFDQKKDLVEVLDMKTRGRSSRARVLLPPGLTDDCIVEYSWRTTAAEGLPLNRYREDYLVQEDYFCKRKVFKINRVVLSSRAGYYATRIGWTKPRSPATFDQREKSGTYTILYGDVPARENYPFGNEHLDPGSAFFTVYKTFPDFGNKPDQFWNRLGRDYFREVYGGKIGSREYRAWLTELKSNLPEDHVKAAVAVYNALRDRIAATDLLPPDLQPVYAKHGDIDVNQANWRARCFELGYAAPAQLTDLFFIVGRDLDLPLQLIMTAPVDAAPFRAEALDPFRLNFWYPFVGMKVNDRWVTFAPPYQNYQAGMLPPYWQGGAAIAFDPENRWKHQVTRISRFGPSVHQMVRRYQMNISAEGRSTVSIQENGSGVFNAENIAVYLPLPPAEAAERVRREWQRYMGGWEIIDTGVTGAESANTQVNIRVSAQNDVDLGDHWFALNPFPGDYMPVALPSVWPENRRQPIIMPHAFTVIDVAKINLPAGWTIRGDANWSKSNDIGKVSFVVVQKGSELTVRRDLVLGRDMLPTDKERELKYLLAWMDEAFHQTLGLKKEEVN